MQWLTPILTPLARLAIRKGWLFQQVEKRLKHAYVKAAESLSDGDVTDSKISIMTGLQRRDIVNLRREAEPLTAQRQPLAEIIALWWSDPDFDPKGIPVQGASPNFTDLARHIRQDVHPRTFLDLLIENGSVSKVGKLVVLNTRSYRPLTGSDDQLTYLAENVGDHLNAAISNVVDAGGFYDMGVHYKGLSANAIDDLNEHYRDRMKQTLKELDTMARAFPESGDGPYRFRAGGYFFDDVDRKAKSDDI